jgi:phage shock protein C
MLFKKETAMYCTNCGVQIGNTDNFCRECGHETGLGGFRSQDNSGYVAERRLMRPVNGGKVAGVCAGLAQYFDLDVTLVRLLFVVGTIFSCGVGLLAYIVAWIIMPRESRAPLRPAPNAGPQTV